MMGDDHEQIRLVERGEDGVGLGNNAPTEWRGLPQFVAQEKRFTLVLSFETSEERDAMIKELDLEPYEKTRWRVSAKYPRDENLKIDLGDVEVVEAKRRVDDLSERAFPEWRGLPRFAPQKKRATLVLVFGDAATRDAKIEELGVHPSKTTKRVISARWPPQPQEDLSSLRFDFGDRDG